MSHPSAFIVEDDPQLNIVFTTALKQDFEVESQQNGELALQTLNQLTPDLIVLDMHLPGASGKQILEYIRAQERLQKTRVILTTADSLLAYSLYDQADLVVLKPVSPIQLRQSALKLFQP
ncbi:MAG: response regulator [Anaerolineales bacterium]|jgi:CheY-like chemotaxis protein|nr:response regulator [Anaerolineales bacterium]